MTTIDIEKLELKAGAHKRPEDGMCLLELTSYLSPKSDFTDHPKCVSPVLAQFGRSWNDALGDEERQVLKPYAAKLLNTATGKKDEDSQIDYTLRRAIFAAVCLFWISLAASMVVVLWWLS